MRPLLAAFALLGLAACADPQPLADFDPHQRFRATVAQRQAVATIAPAEDGGIADADRAVLADLAREHQRRGAGAVVVSVAPGDAAARPFGERIAAALGDAGAADVRVETAEAADARAVSVRVPVWVAVVPTCGEWTEPVSPDFRNQNTANFGCAVVRNAALMVADPADLERARDASGRSGARALDVLTKYGKGEPTSAKSEDVRPVTLTTIGVAR